MNQGRFKAAAALVLLAGGLSACGGGGGGEAQAPPLLAEPVASTAMFQVAAAARRWLQTQQTYAQAPAASYRVVEVSPLAPTSALRTALRDTEFSNLSPAPRTIVRSVLYYQAMPFQYLGTALDENAAMTTGAQATPMPETATVGSSGLLFTMPATGNSGTSFQSSAAWMLEADTAVTAWLCQNFTERTTDAVATRATTRKYCSNIDAAGNLLGFRTSVTTS